jgi:hypothetical protein
MGYKRAIRGAILMEKMTHVVFRFAHKSGAPFRDKDGVMVDGQDFGGDSVDVIIPDIGAIRPYEIRGTIYQGEVMGTTTTEIPPSITHVLVNVEMLDTEDGPQSRHAQSTKVNTVAK